MFEIAAKAGWFAVQPITLLLALLLLAILLVLTGRRRAGVVVMVLAALGLFLAAFTTSGYLLAGILEERFIRPPLPAHIDGIIVLGGAMDADVNNVRGGYELTRSADRFTEALRLAELYPTARIAITGGTGIFSLGSDTEAAAGARFFQAFGIADNRLILENAARNTEDNARLVKALIVPRAGETWLLVTSAFHMPRSVGLFRKIGFDVVPWPADYLSTGAEGFALKLDQPAENLAVTSIAMREWLGLLAYRLVGKIDELLPGPQP